MHARQWQWRVQPLDAAQDGSQAPTEEPWQPTELDDTLRAPPDLPLSGRSHAEEEPEICVASESAFRPAAPRLQDSQWNDSAAAHAWG
jgi:hypothetical protein